MESVDVVNNGSGDGGTNEYKWEGSREKLLGRALETGFRSDLKVVFKNGEECGEMNVHKMVLQIHSPVLDAKICALEEGGKELVLQDSDPQILKILFEYFYKGSVESKKAEEIMKLLQLATEYKVPKLPKICQDLLKKMVNRGNVLDLFQGAMRFGHKSLIKDALSFICGDEAILALDDFKNLSVDCVVEIIKQDNLAVKDEMQVFDAVFAWGMAECARKSLDTSDPQHLRSVLQKVIKWVRFPLMSSEQFALKVATKKIFDMEEQMSLFLSFMVSPENRGQLPEGRFISTPRIYTSGVQKCRCGCHSCQNAQCKSSGYGSYICRYSHA